MRLINTIFIHLKKNESAQFVSNISVTDEFIRVHALTKLIPQYTTKTNVEERCAESVKNIQK